MVFTVLVRLGSFLSVTRFRPARPADRPPIGWGRRRRDLLRMGVAAVFAPATLASCTLSGPRRAEPLSDGALDGPHADALRLARRYDVVIAARPSLAARLTPIRDNHRAHATALARQLGLADPAWPDTGNAPVASAPAAAGDGAGADPSAAPVADDPLPELRTAEQQARAVAEAACLAVAGWRAPLLGSIAASLATHLEVLR